MLAPVGLMGMGVLLRYFLDSHFRGNDILGLTRQ